MNARRNARIARLIAALALALCVALGGVALPALAQDGIKVSNAKIESKFAEYVRYSIAIQSDADVTSATLLARYNTGERSANTTTRGKGVFTPGKSVTAVFTRTLQRGDLVPGTDIEYYWQIENAAGQSLRTPAAAYFFPDDRFDFKSLSAPVGKGKMTVLWYGADEAYGRKRLEVSVGAVEKLQKQVGVELQAEAKVFVYRTREDMLAALPFKGQTNEQSLVTLGQLSNPTTVLLLGGHSDVDNTTYHELSHLVVHLAATNPLIGGVAIPAWLDEGLSMYNQLTVERSYTDAVTRALARDSLISVQSMSAVPGRSDEVIQFYGQSYFLVKYLIETHGKENMLKLLDTFKRGALVDDALKQVYGYGVRELDGRFRSSVGAAPRSGPTEVAVQATSAPSSIAQPTPAPTNAPPATGGGSLPATCACLAPAALGLFWLFVASRRS